MCCHTTASVHCGMIYGKIKIELRYFLNFISVLVTRNAKSPPNRMDMKHVNTERITVFKSGIQRFVFASLLVKRSM